MASKKDTVAITFRLSSDTCRQLDELCHAMGLKRSDFLISMITAEYDRMQGEPQLKSLLEQFKKISETMRSFTGASDCGGVGV